MKKSIACLLAALCLLLSACGNQPPSGTTAPGITTPGTTPGATTAPTVPPLAVTGDYTIVYPTADIRTKEIGEAVTELSTAISLAFGVYPKEGFDAKPPAGIAPGETEILLGDTNREESATAASLLAPVPDGGIHVFCIRVIGRKLVVVGNDAKAVAAGVDRLCTTYLTEGSAGIPAGLFEIRFCTEGEYLMNTGETHPVDELSSVATANGISLDGAPLAAFDPRVTDYRIPLGLTDPLPEVTVSALAGAVCTVKTGETGATISVTSEDKATSTLYTVAFDRAEFDTVPVRIEKVSGGRDGIAVIVHDDGDRTTCTYLSGEYEKNDLRGTIAMVSNRVVNPQTGVIDTNAQAFWQALLDTGRFGISSHSRTHGFWGLTDEAESGNYINSSGAAIPYSFEAGRMTAEIVGSGADLRRAFPSERVLTFVKPGFGRHENGIQISERAYEIIRENYIGMRNTGGGVSAIPAKDIYNLTSYMVQSGEEVSKWKGYVDGAIEQNGMIVFLFHGIVAGSESGISVTQEKASELFAYIGERQESGQLWVTFLDDAVQYTEEYRAATAEAKNYGDRIELTLTDTLDNTVYDHPLTVRVSVPEGWETASFTAADGTKGELTVGRDTAGAFVYADLIPDAGTYTIRGN